MQPPCRSGAFFQAFCQVGPQGREGGRKAAESAGCQGEQQGKGGDASRPSEMESTRGMDSGKQVQCGADGDRGKCQAQQAAGKAEQQAFEDGFTDDHAGTRTQSQPNRVFAAPADGPDQAAARRH